MLLSAAVLRWQSKRVYGLSPRAIRKQRDDDNSRVWHLMHEKSPFHVIRSLGVFQPGTPDFCLGVSLTTFRDVAKFPPRTDNPYIHCTHYPLVRRCDGTSLGHYLPQGCNI